MLRAGCFGLFTLVLVACGDDTGAGASTTGGSPPSSGGSGAGGSPGVGGAGGALVGGSGGVAAGAGGTGGDPQGGQAGGEGGMGGNPPICDGDGDDVPIAGPGCCGAPVECDCDDNDANVFPGQLAFFDVPRPFEDDPILKWDYNCNGIANKR